MTQRIYSGPHGDLLFEHAGEDDALQSVCLAGAFGLPCGAADHDAGPARARGLLLVETARARYEADALRAEALFAESQASLIWHVPDEGLRIDDVWTLHEPSGVWHRSMRLCNESDAPVHLRRCLARFVFAPGRYQIYSQRSGWCDENQGVWRLLDHGAITLGCEGGRTCQGGTPYVVLRDCNSRAAIAFHILPIGNWRIRVAAVTTGPGADSPPFAVVELGLADDRLDLVLAPGDCIDLPDALIQPVPQGEPHLAAPTLHCYLLDEHFRGAKLSAPVVYNTWFDAFEHVELPRLREQLTVAKEVGCEIFLGDFAVFGATCEPYEYLWRIIGSENALVWMAGEPELFEAYVKRVGDWLLALTRQGRLAGMYVYGDVAYRRCMLFSPSWWRRLFKPIVKQIIDECHRHDLMVVYHGCGNAEAIFDDLAEIGLDAYNPLEAKANLNVVELKKKYAGRLAFVGNVDVRVLEAGDPEAIRREVRYKLQAARGGGWVFQSDHSITSDVAPESYALAIECLRQCGNYPLAKEEG